MPVRFAIFLFLSIRVFHSPERIFRFPVFSVRFSWMDATGFHDRFCGMTVFSFGFHCLFFRFFFMFSANVFINRMVCFCVFFHACPVLRFGFICESFRFYLRIVSVLSEFGSDFSGDFRFFVCLFRFSLIFVSVLSIVLCKGVRFREKCPEKEKSGCSRDFPRSTGQRLPSGKMTFPSVTSPAGHRMADGGWRGQRRYSVS